LERRSATRERRAPFRITPCEQPPAQRISASPLQLARASRFVTEPSRADTAFVFLTGYFLIEVESFETAISWAARIPNARTGSVEVRPVMDIDW
jgi:hypothetical protein